MNGANTSPTRSASASGARGRQAEASKEARSLNQGCSHQMLTGTNVIFFKDLPATFPERDKFKKPSVIGSVLFHGLLIFAVIIVPLLMPQSIPERELLVTLVSP